MLLHDPLGRLPGPVAREGFVALSCEDEITTDLLRPFFSSDRENLVILAFDAFERLCFAERIKSRHRAQCAVPASIWRRLSACRGATVRIAHNHPSGAAWPSEADLAATRQIAATLGLLDIMLVDHQILVASGHFSFRRARLL